MKAIRSVGVSVGLGREGLYLGGVAVWGVGVLGNQKTAKSLPRFVEHDRPRVGDKGGHDVATFHLEIQTPTEG